MGGCLYREAAVDFGREGLPGRERNVEKEVAYRKTGNGLRINYFLTFNKNA